MPYAVRREGKKYKVVNEETGDVKGTFSSRKRALRQFRLLEGVEHGWHPTKAEIRDLVVKSLKFLLGG